MAGVFTLVFVVMGAGAIPAPAHAAFFDKVFQFFGGSSQAASPEDMSQEGLSLPLLGSQRSGAMPASGVPVNDGIVLPATQDSALVSTRNPSGTLPRPGSDQIVVYTVEQGDTPSAIADRFGISLQTLLWANNLRTASSIRPGDDLVILPVTGVQYEVKKGDTIESIAKKFKGDAEDIIGFNGLALGEALKVGTSIIIPDGELASSLVPSSAGSLGRVSTPSRFSALPEFAGYYMRPIIGGRNARATRANPHGIHGYNGVDLANSCGLAVLASADGTIILTRSEGWNGGYGRYVVMAHPNGTQTLYGHMSQILASPGQSVSQGSQIGMIGSTGNSTGCHVHFEIRGARNPF